MSRPVLKPYQQNQMMLLPPTWDELIDANDPVRLVNSVVDRLDLEELLKKYSTTGPPSYHPRLLLKVLVYAYMNNIYSSRRIEEACRTHLHMIWMCGGQRPDHNTINRFRTDRFGKVLKEVFSQVVHLLVEQGLTSLEEVYVDGTKMESVAGRYTFVWRKNIERNTQRIAEQLEELWNYAEGVARHELAAHRPESFEAVDPAAVERTIEKIDQALKGKEVDKKVKKKVDKARRNWPGKIKEYQERKEQMGDRNSLSKTDPDATFMRMKDDHMGNSQLKPGYNLQISTHDQFVVNYTLHQNPADTTTLSDHLQNFQRLHKRLPATLVADAGYGSEENYHELSTAGVQAYVKFSHFDKVVNGKQPLSHVKAKGMRWDQDNESYQCPSGEHMAFASVRRRSTANGHEQVFAQYLAPASCGSCPLAAACLVAKAGIVEVSHRLEEYREEAFERLISEEGIRHRKRRGHDVETVFGSIKHNHYFRRCSMRGLSKISIEMGLVLIAHNLRKWAAKKPLEHLWEGLRPLSQLWLQQGVALRTV
jgi:transposase